jgi:hypothetical protein
MRMKLPLLIILNIAEAHKNGRGLRMRTTGDAVLHDKPVIVSFAENGSVTVSKYNSTQCFSPFSRPSQHHYTALCALAEYALLRNRSSVLDVII